MSFPVNTQHIIYCTCNSTTTFIRYLIMDGIHPDYRIDRIKHTWFPCLYFRKYTVCNGTDCICRYTITKILFHPLTNLTCAITKSIQAYYTVCYAFCKNCLTLFNELWIKTWITVTGSGYGYLTQCRLDLFLHFPVTAVAHLTFFCKICIHLTLQSCIQDTFQ